MFWNHLISYCQGDGPAPGSADALENAADYHLIHSLRCTTCSRECGEDKYRSNRCILTAEDVAEFGPYDNHALTVLAAEFHQATKNGDSLV